MTTLILVLPLVRPTAGTEFEYVVSAQRDAMQTHGTAALALLPRADTLVLVVPAVALSWHSVRLPPVSGARLRAALDGLLEEQLLDEPAQLGLALAPARLPNGDALVAAYDKAWLRAMLAFFEQADRPASRVVPEFAPLGHEGAGARWHVGGSAQDARLVMVQPQGLVCVPLASAPALLGAKPAWRADDRVVAEPAVAELAEQALGTAVLVQPAAQRLCDAAEGAWELAQFDLALSGGGRMARRWRQWLALVLHAPTWRGARWGTLALLLVHLVGLNAWAWKLDARVRDQQQQVRSTLTQAFPEIRTVVDAPLQMQRQFDLLRRSGGALASDDMESMLSALGAALPAGRHATGIDFAPGQLTLQGLDLADSAQAALRDSLGAQGYRLQAQGDRLVMRAGDRP